MRRAPRRNASGVGITSGLLPVRRQFGSPPMGEIDMGIHMQPQGMMQPQGPMNMGAPGGLNASFTSMMDPSGGGVPNMGGTSIMPQGTDISQMGLDVGGQQQAQAQEQVEQDDLAKNVDLTLTEIIDLLETYRETGNFSGMLKLVGNLPPEVIKLISSVTSEEDDFATKVQKEKDVLAQVLGVDDDEGKMQPEMADFLMALGASLMSNKSGSGMSGAFSAIGEAGMKALPTLTAGRKEKEALEKQIALSAYGTVSAREAAEAKFQREKELKKLDVEIKSWVNPAGEIIAVNESVANTAEGSSILGYLQAGEQGYVPKSGSGVNIDMSQGTGKAIFDYYLTGVTENRTALKAGKEVYDKLEIMDRILSSDIRTGPLEESLMPIRQWMRNAGWLTEEEKTDLAEQEIFKAASSYVVPRMRAVGSGATSDFEATLYQSAIANMGYGPETNRFIIKTHMVIYEKAEKILDMQEDYLFEHEDLRGFNEWLEEEITVDGVTKSRELHEAPLFEVFTMKEVKDGKTDFDIAVEKGKIKKGDLYLDEKLNRLEIYGYEKDTYKFGE